jgi:hypothetical protein
LEETIHFASSSNLSRAQFLILDVLPGCELWDTLGGQFCPNWSKDSCREPEWLPTGVTRNQLVRAQIRAFRKFYLANPGRLFMLATSVRPSQVKYLMKRLLDYRIIGSTGATAARPTIRFPSVSAEAPREKDVSRAA